MRFTGNGDSLEPRRSYNVELDLLYSDVDYRNVASRASFTICKVRVLLVLVKLRRARRKPPNNRIVSGRSNGTGPTRARHFIVRSRRA